MVVLPLLCGAVPCGLRRALRVMMVCSGGGSIADTRSGVAFLRQAGSRKRPIISWRRFIRRHSSSQPWHTRMLTCCAPADASKPDYT